VKIISPPILELFKKRFLMYTKKFTQIIIELLLTVLWVSTTTAGSISFYEGNDGKQDLLGVLSDEYEKPQKIRNQVRL
jgi:hypothetical protein